MNTQLDSASPAAALGDERCWQPVPERGRANAT